RPGGADRAAGDARLGRGRARRQVAARGAAAAVHAAPGAALQRVGVVDLLAGRPAGAVRGPRAALGAVPLLRGPPGGEPGARAGAGALVRDVGAGAPGDPRGVGAGARVAAVPRRAVGARRRARAAPPPGIGAGADAVLRGAVRVREHPPLLHGQRDL